MKMIEANESIKILEKTRGRIVNNLEAKKVVLASHKQEVEDLEKMLVDIAGGIDLLERHQKTQEVNFDLR